MNEKKIHNNSEEKIKKLLTEIKKLREENEELKSRRKKYGIVWEEEKEPEKVVLECKEKIPILKDIKDKEILTDENKPFNILIEGDNYHALQVLNYTHKGKIDVIYIDPPYNTGKANEWKYNDRYVDENDTYRHSKWLNFMDKRLQLAKDLLNEDIGIIFISINDIELSQLKLLCNKFFGENNVEIMIWYKIPEEGAAGQGKMKITHRFRLDHEYILVCYKNKNKLKFNKPLRIKKVKNNYGNLDNDPRGDWVSCEICKSETKSNPLGKNYYSIKTSKGRIIKRQWHMSYEEFLELDKDKRIYWGSGKIIPRLKKFINEPRPITPSSIIMGISQTEANNELKELFGKKVFDNPKPLNLIKWILEMSSKKDSIILDYFAGSGTTGHAVIDLNKEDSGQRKFILCTNDENGICTEVCYPRLSKVIKGYNGNKGIKSNLKYFKTNFVDAGNIYKISDEKKIELTYKAGEMIAIREDAFEEVEKNEWWQIFKNKNKTVSVYFREDQSKLEKLFEKNKNTRAIVYLFSWGKNELKAQEYGYDNIEIKDIPQPIIEVYKEINSL
ncbi:MAG: site-specific DNA-methyltransferase [Candidatus Humimicrobiia bacterium]